MNSESEATFSALSNTLAFPTTSQDQTHDETQNQAAQQPAQQDGTFDLISVVNQDEEEKKEEEVE